MNTQIFREYDIRGVADRDLTSSTVELIGKAYGTFLKRQKKTVISLSRDCRVSSPRIHEAFLKGVLSTGVNVYDIGLTTTPCLYFSIFHLKTQGGVMITGSHNPPDQNGLKMCIDTASLFGSQIQELKGLIEKSDFETGQGKVTEKPVLKIYTDYIKGLFKSQNRLKVVVDCGNGMTGMIAPEVFKSFGHEVIELYTKVDGTFPNHPADPSEPKNLKELIEQVKVTKAHVGLAFDGDGDRVGVVDHEGNIIPGDILLILYSRAILAKKKGGTFIADVKCSNLLFQDIETHGGRAIMWKTGHSLIKAKMKEEKAVLAGEMSGHMFFADRWFGFDSGIYGACRVLEILDETQKTIPSLLSGVPKTVATPEIRVSCPDDKKFNIVRRVVESFKTEKYQVVDIDGVRVEFKDGWGLLRASNTQPVLVMRFEAQNEKRLNEIRQLIEAKVKEFSK
ncbi:MAG: phosphomannomutase [Candidatus Omnitrophica bacterium CG11_big_fil_rev_8_21_14_0_20_45_26]|uniref:Phosphomannomutase n=1 Tax=Candidatus Abzuiibacterium crystallinum TaxID=1974748 RepID=A0A2H0LQ46_9BACT|nr:MAG: phosphomannomutase [Candidatus Omnitrophica bacterium CG11_big_fil_rev_8_21_14_0_20_45_26]PIW65631.1 MAG: phosphomannomutase [Candidatus Omnitrophica bacterium CG12_big_fil_rev_8_21_14_0_65_45_16]